MQTRSFKPSPQYLTKIRLGITIVALLTLAGKLPAILAWFWVVLVGLILIWLYRSSRATS